MELKDAVQLATEIVEQWEKYDQYRATKLDKLLYKNGEEPDEVVVSRALINLYCEKHWP